MRHTPDAIRHLLTNQQDSGQTVATFCAERGLKVATFYSWRRKYREPEPEVVGGFCQLTQTAQSEPRGLQLPSGLRVELTGMTAWEIAALILEIDRAYA